VESLELGLTMIQSRKYDRTYHFPFSKGAQNDDKISFDWQGILENELVITEKLDGENTCLKADGVYARSHAAPTRNPWAENMWQIWSNAKPYLGDLEIFGENLYGIHSIEYSKLPAYFFVFAIRDGDTWLSWDEVTFYAQALDLHTAPVLARGRFTETQLTHTILEYVHQPSTFGGEMEGVVVRNVGAFLPDVFYQNVLKYVRANHVQTDEHWTRRWKKAKLII
jgi:RNA ligase